MECKMDCILVIVVKMQKYLNFQIFNGGATAENIFNFF